MQSIGPTSKGLSQARVCVVTGANSGIGKATAIALASEGATIVAVCRNRERGEQAVQDIVREAGNVHVCLELADLSSQQAIRALARSIAGRFQRIEALVHSAGATFFDRRLSPDHIEMNWAVNVLAPFLLTQRLRPLLAAGAPSRVVILTGRYAPRVTIRFDDLQLEHGFSAWTAVKQVALAKILLTAEFGRRFQATGVSVNCVYPGPVRTELQSKLPWGYRLMAAPIRLFFQSPSQGAKGPVFLASDQGVIPITGGYFERTQQVRLPAGSIDRHDCNRLWAIAERMTA